MLPVLKHLPGHGRATADSHLRLPVVDTDRATLEATDFAAFRPLSSLPLGMTAHVVFSAIDAAQPATTSAIMIGDVIRGSIGFRRLADERRRFDGSLVRARWPSAAALRSRPAAISCSTATADLDEMREVADASPLLAGEAAAPRRARACAAAACRSDFDVAAARARFAEPDESASRRSDRLMTAEIIPFGSEMAERASDEPALVVDVEGFEGPLDLLLTLARQQKVDLAKISILALADQYLAFIEAARTLRLELAADYLVMAAWLAYLKSRLLLPDLNPAEGQSAEDMATALAFRLKRLEAFRQVAQKLMDMPQLERDMFSRGDPEPIRDIKHPQWTATLYDLLSAYAVQRQKTRARPGALQEAQGLDARRGARADRAADRRDRRLEPARSVPDRLSGRTVDGRDRDRVELRLGARNGARGRDRVAAARGLRAALYPQAQGQDPEMPARTARHGDDVESE